MANASLGLAFDASQIRRFGQLSRRWSVTMPGKMVAEGAGAAVDLLEACRAAIQKKTGGTASTLKVKLSHGLGTVRLEVTGNKVAMWLISGTRPHEIRPVRAQVLRFRSRGGGIVYARLAHHPGTKGHDWRPRAVGLATPKLTSRGLRIVRSMIVGLKAEAAAL